MNATPSAQQCPVPAFRRKTRGGDARAKAFVRFVQKSAISSALLERYVCCRRNRFGANKPECRDDTAIAFLGVFVLGRNMESRTSPVEERITCAGEGGYEGCTRSLWAQTRSSDGFSRQKRLSARGRATHRRDISLSLSLSLSHAYARAGRGAGGRAGGRAGGWAGGRADGGTRLLKHALLGVNRATRLVFFVSQKRLFAREFWGGVQEKAHAKKTD